MAKLSDLFTDGVIVAVHVGEWRARLGMMPGDIRLDVWDAEVERAMYLGAHRLATAADFEAIHKATNEAGRLVDRSSIPFPIITGGRYMPADKLEAVAVELRRCQSDFNAAVETFCEPERFELMKARQLSEVIRPALEALLVRDGVVDREAVERSLARIRDGYPTAAKARECFSLSWRVFSLQSASSETVAALSGEADQVRGLLADMMGDLRREIREKVEDVLGLVARGGKIGKRTVDSALAVVERVEGLNLWGDEVLTASCARLRAVLLTVQGTGELATVQGLQDVAASIGADVSQAVAAAEASLTAFGRRKVAA